VFILKLNYRALFGTSLDPETKMEEKLVVVVVAVAAYRSFYLNTFAALQHWCKSLVASTSLFFGPCQFLLIMDN